MSDAHAALTGPDLAALFQANPGVNTAAAHAEAYATNAWSRDAHVLSVELLKEKVSAALAAEPGRVLHILMIGTGTLTVSARDLGCSPANVVLVHYDPVPVVADVLSHPCDGTAFTEEGVDFALAAACIRNPLVARPEVCSLAATLRPGGVLIVADLKSAGGSGWAAVKGTLVALRDAGGGALSSQTSGAVACALFVRGAGSMPQLPAPPARPAVPVYKRDADGKLELWMEVALSSESTSMRVPVVYQYVAEVLPDEAPLQRYLGHAERACGGGPRATPPTHLAYDGSTVDDTGRDAAQVDGKGCGAFGFIPEAERRSRLVRTVLLTPTDMPAWLLKLLLGSKPTTAAVALVIRVLERAALLTTLGPHSPLRALFRGVAFANWGRQTLGLGDGSAGGYASTAAQTAAIAAVYGIDVDLEGEEHHARRLTIAWRVCGRTFAELPTLAAAGQLPTEADVLKEAAEARVTAIAAAYGLDVAESDQLAQAEALTIAWSLGGHKLAELPTLAAAGKLPSEAVVLKEAAEARVTAIAAAYGLDVAESDQLAQAEALTIAWRVCGHKLAELPTLAAAGKLPTEADVLKKAYPSMKMMVTPELRAAWPAIVVAALHAASCTRKQLYVAAGNISELKEPAKTVRLERCFSRSVAPQRLTLQESRFLGDCDRPGCQRGPTPWRLQRRDIGAQDQRQAVAGDADGGGYVSKCMSL